MSPREVLTIFDIGIFNIFSGNASAIGSLGNTSNPSMNTDYEVIQDFSGVIVLLSGF